MAQNRSGSENKDARPPRLALVFCSHASLLRVNDDRSAITAVTKQAHFRSTLTLRALKGSC